MTNPESPALTGQEIGHFNWLLQMIEGAPNADNFRVCLIRAELDGKWVSVMAVDHGAGPSPIPVLTPCAIMLDDDLYARLKNPFGDPFKESAVTADTSFDYDPNED